MDLKGSVVTVIAAMCLVGVSHTGFAAEESGLYVGVVGGVGRTGGQSVEQLGVAHKLGNFNGGFPDFDLKVDVDGTVEHGKAGLFGLQTGFGWKTSSALKPAVEIEGLYHVGSQHSELENPDTEVLANIVERPGQSYTTKYLRTYIDEHYGPDEHRFANSMDTRTSLGMINGVLSYDRGSRVKPYVGVGVGLAVIQMKNGVSYQTSPLNGSSAFEIDPVSGADVNHYNSQPDASDVALAMQVKTGVRGNLTSRVSAFVEYRLIHVDESTFTFGSTSYAGHSPTDHWSLTSGASNLHHAVVGLALRF